MKSTTFFPKNTQQCAKASKTNVTSGILNKLEFPIPIA